MATLPRMPIAAPEAASDEIMFIGSRISFPDIMLRLIGNEIGGLHLRRVEAGVPEAVDGARLVLFEEACASQLVERAVQWRSEGCRTIFVLAYRDAAFARALLHGTPDVAAVDWLRFLPAGLSADTLVAMLRILLARNRVIPAELVPPPESVAPVTDALTAREAEVLALVARGRRNKSIASEINVSEHTVKLHIHNLIRKLGVANRTEAANWFLSRQERRL